MGLAGHPPRPAVRRPPRAARIAAGFDERQERPLADRRGIDVEGRDLHGVTPFFIVEDEALVRPAAEFDFAGGKSQPLGRVWQIVSHRGAGRRRVAQGLKRHPPGLDVHQFVIQAEFGEVGRRLVECVAQAGSHGLRHLAGVIVHCGGIRQGQVPAAVVRHGRRIIERVGPGQQAGGTAAVRPRPQAPAFLKPDDMPDFPQRRIQMVRARSQPAALRQAIDQCTQLAARLRQLGDELVGAVAADGRGAVHVI